MMPTPPAPATAATGAVRAATQLNADGTATRVVSLPSWDRFAAQGAEYRQQLLPAGVPVLSVEAAATFGWEFDGDAECAWMQAMLTDPEISAPGDRLRLLVEDGLQAVAFLFCLAPLVGPCGELRFQGLLLLHGLGAFSL